MCKQNFMTSDICLGRHKCFLSFTQCSGINDAWILIHIMCSHNVLKLTMNVPIIYYKWRLHRKYYSNVFHEQNCPLISGLRLCLARWCLAFCCSPSSERIFPTLLKCLFITCFPAPLWILVLISFMLHTCCLLLMSIRLFDLHSTKDTMLIRPHMDQNCRLILFVWCNILCFILPVRSEV